MTTATVPSSQAYGVTLLRVTLGVLFLVHFLIKLLVFTPAGTAQYFHSIGLPEGMAYLTMCMELLLAVTLILGVYARWFALLGVALLLGTIVVVHGANGFTFNNQGGGWEYPAVWAMALLVQCLLGDGILALKSR